MANVIKFDSGIKEYSLNDAVTVYFNPTDMTFIDSVFSAFEDLDNIQTRYQEETKDIEKTKDLFPKTRAMDEDMRGVINGIFGVDVCTPLVGKMSIYAIADGLPIWANLMLAIIDELDASFIAEKKKTNPRIQKYTQKYAKKSK